MNWIKKLGAIALLLFIPSIAFAQQNRCSVAWSHYTGWEPLGYIQDSGTAKRWGQKYGVDLKFTLINDYVESISQYTAKGFDGVAVTNMDALTNPALAGRDSSFVVIGDFSNGNDGILINGPKGSSVMSLKGRQVKLVELSVSHYLLSRALEKSGLLEKDVTVVNTSDADIGGFITASKPGDAFVTWNPILLTGRNVPNMQMIFESSMIPGEIIDGIVLGTEVSENCKKAVAGAWYEAIRTMTGTNPESAAMIKSLAAQAGGTEAEFQAQLKTTRILDAKEGSEFSSSKGLKDTMSFVAKFAFEKGIYGDKARSPEHVGIEFGDKSVWGDSKNVKLRFPSTYMELARDGKL
jgi:NitT/TauT family transport system substrate-binding protein